MIDDERIIREALQAGPTPGPWTPMPAGAGEQCVARVNNTEAVPPKGVELAHDSVDASYIAACSPDRIERLLAEVERLRAELAETRLDAERYRWLRDSKIADDADRWICAHECTLHEVAELDGERLDAAIDRALGAE